jgi:hypothetical protein
MDVHRPRFWRWMRININTFLENGRLTNGLNLNSHPTCSCVFLNTPKHRTRYPGNIYEQNHDHESLAQKLTIFEYFGAKALT